MVLDVESQFIQMMGGETMVRWYWGIGGVLWIIAVLGAWFWGWELRRW